MPLHHIHSEPDFAFGVWRIEEEYQNLKMALCEQDHRSVDVMTNVHRASESAAARLLLKEICEHEKREYKGVGKDSNGAPLLGEGNSHVSISHTKGYAAGIIHSTRSVGIDIELLSDRISQMAHRVLSDQEMSMVKGEPDKAVVFWAMKETLYKIYRKRGLNFATELQIDDFELHQEGLTTAEIRANGESKQYTLFYELMDGLAVTYGF